MFFRRNGNILPAVDSLLALRSSVRIADGLVVGVARHELILGVGAVRRLHSCCCTCFVLGCHVITPFRAIVMGTEQN